MEGVLSRPGNLDEADMLTVVQEAVEGLSESIDFKVDIKCQRVDLHAGETGGQLVVFFHCLCTLRKGIVIIQEGPPQYS